ncbi:hypothetical protein ACKWTF_001525 [Chironomus riparius]
MKLKVLLSTFIFVLKFSSIVSQVAFFICFYHLSSSGYACELEFFNPNGLNNFEDIDGMHLPGFTDDDVVELNLFVRTNSPNIPAIICQKFRNLRFINLGQNTFQRVDDYSFSNCTSLSFLILQDNEISFINERAFIRNSELRTLHMSFNLIKALPENLFQNQINLDFIDFNNNLISDLPTSIFKSLKKLTYWNFGFNQLSSPRHEWFENLQSLETLYYHYNSIAELPRNIFSRLLNIKQIELYGNNLKMIHADSFGFLPTLQSLNLFFNNINAFDGNLIDYTGITDVDLTLNLCANRLIQDSSATRAIMRAELSQCIRNYDNIMSVCRQNSKEAFEVSSINNNKEECSAKDQQIRKLEAEVKILRNVNFKLLTDKEKNF